MQSACLSPIAQLNAWSSGTKPWSYPGVEAEVKKAMLLRESLAPYLYTAFAQYWRDGIPPIRPMSLVDGGLETDQYLLGDDLLVVPVFAGVTERRVRLPEGRWIDFETGAAFAGTIVVRPSLGTIPLFVREGAAIPTFPPGTTNLSTVPADAPYDVRLFGPGPWKGRLYEDDGTTFGYEKGDFGTFDLVGAPDGTVSATAVAGKRKAVSRRLAPTRIG